MRLMNTIWADRSGVHDALHTTGGLRGWLAAVEPESAGAPRSVATSDVAHFRALRDALRRLAAVVTGDTRPAATSAIDDIHRAVAEVNHAVTQAPTWPQLTFDHGEMRSHRTGEATATMRSLSSIAAEAITLFTGEDRLHLKACHAPGCVLYFAKDHPRREWCCTACGNRARAARHYERHHRPPAPIP